MIVNNLRYRHLVEDELYISLNNFTETHDFVSLIAQRSFAHSNVVLPNLLLD